MTRAAFTPIGASSASAIAPAVSTPACMGSLVHEIALATSERRSRPASARRPYRPRPPSSVPSRPAAAPSATPNSSSQRSPRATPPNSDSSARRASSFNRTEEASSPSSSNGLPSVRRVSSIVRTRIEFHSSGAAPCSRMVRATDDEPLTAYTAIDPLSRSAYIACAPASAPPSASSPVSATISLVHDSRAASIAGSCDSPSHATISPLRRPGPDEPPITPAPRRWAGAAPGSCASPSRAAAPAISDEDPAGISTTRHTVRAAGATRISRSILCLAIAARAAATSPYRIDSQCTTLGLRPSRSATTSRHLSPWRWSPATRPPPPRSVDLDVVALLIIGSQTPRSPRAAGSLRLSRRSRPRFRSPRPVRCTRRNTRCSAHR